MDEKSFRDAKQACYSLAHSLGKNGDEQAKLVTALHDIESHSMKCGESNERIIQLMLSMFYDCLAFGNWPWWNEANQKQAEDRLDRDSSSTILVEPRTGKDSLD